jgi:D-sedoheptulose 7-phosphate isomerase
MGARGHHMTSAERNGFELHFRRSREVLERACAEPDFLPTVVEIAHTLTRVFGNGGKLLLAGNGGSAADAQHIAAEFLSRFKFDRAPLPAIALTTDTSVLTAVGNDYGFDQIFERQVKGLGRHGDVFLGISTSGQSSNVLAALGAARELGITTVGFTGSAASRMRGHCDLLLAAPSDVTALIQQVHLAAAHAICEYVEQALFANSASSAHSRP